MTTFSTVTVKFSLDGPESEVIDLTGADLRVMVKKAYDLSDPQGRGFIHFKLGHTLSEEETDSLMAKGIYSYLVLSLDYVLGRAVKLSVYHARELANPPEGMTMWMHSDWFDHSNSQLEALLEACMAKKEK